MSNRKSKGDKVRELLERLPPSAVMRKTLEERERTAARLHARLHALQQPLEMIEAARRQLDPGAAGESFFNSFPPLSELEVARQGLEYYEQSIVVLRLLLRMSEMVEAAKPVLCLGATGQDETHE